MFNQTLKNNSEISFINTDVIRQARGRDANVSAVDFTIKDKKIIMVFMEKENTRICLITQ